MKNRHLKFLVSGCIMLLLTIAGTSQAGSMTQTDISITVDQEAEILDFRGINYGHYRLADGGPGQGEIVAEANIREDLQIMQNLGVTDIRTYRLSDGLENLPIMSQEYNITTSIVTWIAPWMTDQEIFGGIDKALSFENDSSMTILGNEPLLRQEYSPEEYQEFINYANKKRSPGSKIALAEPHYIFTNAPQLAENVTTLMVHIYPAWEGIPIAEAATYTVNRFLDVREAFPDKELYLGEFGWPSGPGGPFTEENQKRYYDDIMPMLLEHDIDPYVFSIFDEEWKSETYSTSEATYEIGPHWGIFEEDREGKPASETIANYYGGETVERILEPPLVNSPPDEKTSIGSTISLSWTITDEDSGEGFYTIYKNNQLFGQKDAIWIDSVPITFTVDTSIPGSYDYRIDFSDGKHNGSDVVTIIVTDPNSTSDTIEADTLLVITTLGVIPILTKRRDTH